ncbi:hypothetical protein DDZ16_08425 [Marinilabilia rubra]|uniref:Uncharacterized protein n=1 Tax=Marinilabilia rubra TaxID=2162893 RepID=A0A2U2BA08_9BACT|nr:hypothetical protein DDZ16_08425 [Marinilabilia rubra]
MLIADEIRKLEIGLTPNNRYNKSSFFRLRQWIDATIGLFLCFKLKQKTLLILREFRKEKKMSFLHLKA